MEKVISNIQNINSLFDGAYTYSICKQLLQYINKSYFRARLIGFDEPLIRNNPNRPLIFMSNHSGMAFPWDAITFCSKFLDHNEFNMYNSVRALTSSALSKASFMSPFLVKDFWKRLGAIDASTLNFESSMIDNSANILIYPEGVPGIAKGFDQKYHLQRFATSAIRMSIKHQTDIIPFATVNGEYINPYSYSIDKFNRFLQKLGMPFFPIGLSSLLIPLQPWFFYFAFPAHLTYVKGEVFKPYKMVNNRPLEEVSEDEIKYLSDLLKKQMQAELDQSVKKYGKSPYNFKGLIKNWWNNRSKFHIYFPVMWPFLFTEQDRRFKKAKQTFIDKEEWPVDQESQMKLAKKVFKKLSNKELSLGNGFKTIFHHPQLLLLYTPFVGLLHLFKYER